ncbi:hypothetical protein [Priestia endophytica]|uniref:hypothetical protein n=1 Tax=Priestia endophytica TaxID=135735 RepID=UPI00124E1D37|nr:hypothetical protein [Priestia endophytica]KAB2489624.1 hypothetical protein F8155_23090 [Priestia endophytica]
MSFDLLITGKVSIQILSLELCSITFNRPVSVRSTGQYLPILTTTVDCETTEGRTELKIESKVIDSTEILVNVYSKYYTRYYSDSEVLQYSKETKDFLIHRGESKSLTHFLQNPLGLNEHSSSTATLKFKG